MKAVLQEKGAVVDGVYFCGKWLIGFPVFGSKSSGCSKGEIGPLIGGNQRQAAERRARHGRQRIAISILVLKQRVFDAQAGERMMKGFSASLPAAAWGVKSAVPEHSQHPTGR